MTLRQWRRMRDLTMYSMAEALEIALPTYRSIENDPDRATIRQAKKIAEVLGASVADIFFPSDSSFGRVSGGEEREKRKESEQPSTPQRR